MLIPASVEECFTMATDAFDLAEQFQTLVFVMSDLDLGMNNWMSDPFRIPTTPIQRGKVLSKEDLDKVGEFARYKDIDGDGIGYRTLPGTIIRRPRTSRAAVATTRRGSTASVRTTSRTTSSASTKNLRPLVRLCRVRKSTNGKSKIGIIGFGTSHWAITESRDQLRDEYQIETDYLRLKSYPFTREVHDFIEQHDRLYVVEQNRDATDGQLCSSSI